MTAIQFSSVTKCHQIAKAQNKLHKIKEAKQPGAIVSVSNRGSSFQELYVLDETDAQRVIDIETDTYQSEQNRLDAIGKLPYTTWLNETWGKAGKRILDIIRSGLPVGEDIAVHEREIIDLEILHTGMKPDEVYFMTTIKPKKSTPKAK